MLLVLQQKKKEIHDLANKITTKPNFTLLASAVAAGVAETVGRVARIASISFTHDRAYSLASVGSKWRVERLSTAVVHLARLVVDPIAHP